MRDLVRDGRSFAPRVISRAGDARRMSSAFVSPTHPRCLLLLALVAALVAVSGCADGGARACAGCEQGGSAPDWGSASFAALCSAGMPSGVCDGEGEDRGRPGGASADTPSAVGQGEEARAAQGAAAQTAQRSEPAEPVPSRNVAPGRTETGAPRPAMYSIAVPGHRQVAARCFPLVPARRLWFPPCASKAPLVPQCYSLAPSLPSVSERGLVAGRSR